MSKKGYKLNIRKKLLTPNKYSRPQVNLHEVKAIVIHWVANPGTNAEFNRRFFELRKNGKYGYGSAHYIVDTDEIIQCIPDSEVAWNCGTTKPISENSTQVYTDKARELFGSYAINYNSSSPNYVTLGVEMCHEDWTGKFSIHVLEKTKKLLTNLCLKYNLDPKTQIFTHNQVVGWKDCPRWFTNNPEKLSLFLSRVNQSFQAYKSNLEPVDSIDWSLLK